MQPALRAPRADDYPLLCSWIPDAAACLRWAGPQLAWPFDPDQLAERLHQPRGASCVLADAGGHMLGFGQYWVWEPGAVHLGRLLIDPARRGQGLGRSLLTHLMPAAVQATGAASITLRVYRNNTPALALYQALGFREEAAHSSADVAFMRRNARAIE
ncbi:GNAT family N-acetyltransferase [Massilia sp. TS11]|uniref:GNAT family N-acetyltransferase n=1 Tax=Massilia sp. TS11 TaxID=2908003 RepID=UPI001EDBE156|nr:GNAT family N-acetyltransferase [Massilia sp. TS11]MCG2586226.1 GNAT family N-acetyltransferase [Massilia sp. TS11]